MLRYLMDNGQISHISDYIALSMYTIKGVWLLIQCVPCDSQSPQLRYRRSASLDLVAWYPEDSPYLDIAFNCNTHWPACLARQLLNSTF